MKTLLLPALLLCCAMPALAQGTRQTAAQIQRAQIVEQMRSIRLSQVQFQEASVAEALEFIQIKARESSKTAPNIMLKLPDDEKKLLAKVSLNLRDVPIAEALRYIAELSNLVVMIESNAVVVTSATYAQNQFVTRIYNVPPDFLVSGIGK